MKHLLTLMILFSSTVMAENMPQKSEATQQVVETEEIKPAEVVAVKTEDDKVITVRVYTEDDCD